MKTILIFTQWFKISEPSNIYSFGFITDSYILNNFIYSIIYMVSYLTVFTFCYVYSKTFEEDQW